MTESFFEHIRLSNGATVNDAIGYLNGLRATDESLGWRERELLSVAEGLLELVRLGAVIYMDSAAIEADLYGTEIAAPG